MEITNSFFELFLNLDKQLFLLVTEYKNWTYLILFCIIFCETGLVVTPFLPGDSLLFAAGAMSALVVLNIWILIGLLCIAAILGDSANYSIGKFLGQKVFERDYRLIKKEYLYRTHDFYEKHGGKTIIIARFVPIIRTFAPFIAGVGSMNYSRFISFNIIGGILWVFICSFGGYFFGNLPFVKSNFSVVVLAIILISLLPMVVEYIKYKLKPEQNKKL
jgi:membrane-associated protein